MMLSSLSTQPSIARILVFSDFSTGGEPHPLFTADAQDQSWELVSTNSLPDDFSEYAGAVILLDANIGLSPAAIDFWQGASDESLARQVLVTKSVGARADFDEMVAIVRRVLEPDAQVRYFPLADDDEQTAVGLLDVVNQEIVSYLDDNEVLTPADLEHMELTHDDREELFDVAAHAAFADEDLANFNAGLPLDLRAMRAATLSSDVVLVSPCEDRVGIKQFFDWCSARTN